MVRQINVYVLALILAAGVGLAGAIAQAQEGTPEAPENTQSEAEQSAADEQVEEESEEASDEQPDDESAADPDAEADADAPREKQPQARPFYEVNQLPERKNVGRFGDGR